MKSEAKILEKRWRRKREFYFRVCWFF